MRTYKNQISAAMSEYRMDFRANKEFWMKTMGTGNNNEFLYIRFKSGDVTVVQSEYFEIDCHTCLPRFRADEVLYISRYYGDGLETLTAADIVIDTDRIILYDDGKPCFCYDMSEKEFEGMKEMMWNLDDDEDMSIWEIAFCRALAASKMDGKDATTCDDAHGIRFFSSVDGALEYVKSHEDSGDHSEKELNEVMMFGLGVYAYSYAVTASGIADCSQSVGAFYHFRDDEELRRFIQYLMDSDGYLVASS